MPEVPAEAVTRRDFVRRASAATVIVCGGSVPLLSCRERVVGPDTDSSTRPLLRAPVPLSASGSILAAAPGQAQVIPGTAASAWLFNGQMPGPTVQARRGSHANIRLQNQLTSPTIVHWHGLIVPEAADGHPRYAIAPGAAYDYSFPVTQRACTSWYHPHAHHLTGEQVARGLAGFFIVADDEEDALQLPSGDREVLLLLQDRDAASGTAFEYAASADDHLTGMLRSTPYGNGVRQPRLDVVGARYRFRVLNASQARVFRLGLDDGRPLTVIGNDGGLLRSAVDVDTVWLGVGERVDFIVDFSSVAVGTRLVLRSLPFSIPGSPAATHPQGLELDVLELVRVAGGTAGDVPLPASLSAIPSLNAASAIDRSFVLQSSGHADHTINGLTFDMHRVDVQIPLGRTERWRFHNNSTLPHPVHLHGTHFQIVSRSGGRGQVFPYEAGWKDTVLLLPLETVEVFVRFDAWTGIFPLHCHTLQHEDMGMMLNIEVTGAQG